MVLEAKNLTKIYQLDGISVKALDGPSFSVKEGDFVAITGSSGSGKSTLMHIIGCLDTPTSGTVFIEGQEVSKLSENKLAEVRNQKIGFVFQSFNLIPRVDAIGNASLPLVYAGISGKNREQRAVEALKRLGLADRLHHFPNQLSGGQQQRVAIARALITNPTIILADEPTGNVDSKTASEIMELFANLNHEGHTIIIVTHDKEVAAYAKRKIVMKDGRIV